MINNKEIYKLQKDVKALQDAPPPEIPDIDLSDYYTKPQVDNKIPPKDYGECRNDTNVVIQPNGKDNSLEYVVFKNNIGSCISYDVRNVDTTDFEMTEFWLNFNEDNELDFSSAQKRTLQGSVLKNTLSKLITNSKSFFDKFIANGYSVETSSDFTSLPYEQQQARATDINLAEYIGKNGQLVVNTTNKSLHVMDGETPGGVELAKKSEAFEKDWGELHMAWMPGFVPPTDYDRNKKYLLLLYNGNGIVKLLMEDPQCNTTNINSNKIWTLVRQTDEVSFDFSNREPSSNNYELSKIRKANIYYSSQAALDLVPLSVQNQFENKKTILGGAANVIEVSNVTGTNADMELYAGTEGQIVYNKETKTIHAMDGVTAGGKALATKEELDQVFQSVSSGKSKVETAITDKGGTVSKVGQVATFDELVTAINTIPIGDPDHVCREEGKQELLDMMISKLPSLENKLTIDSSLHDFAHYLNMIGEMLFAFREMFSAIPIDSVAGAVDPVVLEQFQAIMDMNVMEDQHTPFTEIFEAFTIPDVSGGFTPITLSTTIAERVEVTEEAFGHVLYFRDNTSYMFIMNKMSFELGEDYIGLNKNHILTAEDSNGIKVININMEDFNKIVQMEVEI